MRKNSEKPSINSAYGVIFLALFCLFFTGRAWAEGKKIRVMTSLFPLYDFTRLIGGNWVQVELVLPPGVEPHGFEPRPRDMARIKEAALFIYSGAGLEPWIPKVKNFSGQTGPVFVDASDGCNLAGADADAHTGEQGESHSGIDPHYWLDLENMCRVVQKIAAVLAKTDPEHGNIFRENAAGWERELRTLDSRFKSVLTRCTCRTLIYGGHFAFGYFARRYGLKLVTPYRGFSLENEPTPKRLVDLLKTIHGSNCRSVFYEELLEPKVARVISQETGARLFLLHGGHNISAAEFSRGVHFLDLMRTNLENLKQALGCQ